MPSTPVVRMSFRTVSGVGGLFRCSLQTKAARWFPKGPAGLACRLDLNDPPTFPWVVFKEAFQPSSL